jgi:hypothetical protein
MYSVFISYSHVDATIANDVCARLDSAGVSYFRDIKNIDWGDGINEQVRESLLDSESILVIVSPASLKSLWVPYEIGYCAALNKKVLPYLVHPSLDLPGYIDGVKHITNLDDLSAYFARPIREWGTVYNRTAKQLPDVRVGYSPAIARGSRGETNTVVVFSVANHDDKPVYMNNVSLLLDNKMRMQIHRDVLTGQPYYRKTLNPGERMDVRITRDTFISRSPFAPNGIDPETVVGVVASDDIGREFHGDPARLVATLLELFPERRK